MEGRKLAASTLNVGMRGFAKLKKHRSLAD